MPPLQKKNDKNLLTFTATLSNIYFSLFFLCLSPLLALPSSRSPLITSSLWLSLRRLSCKYKSPWSSSSLFAPIFRIARNAQSLQQIMQNGRRNIPSTAAMINIISDAVDMICMVFFYPIFIILKWWEEAKINRYCTCLDFMVIWAQWLAVGCARCIKASMIMKKMDNPVFLSCTSCIYFILQVWRYVWNVHHFWVKFRIFKNKCPAYPRHKFKSWHQVQRYDV